MDFPLTSAYQSFARFAYASMDRLVLTGYVGLLQHPGGFVSWARRLLPDQPISSSWIASFASRFHKGVQKFAEEHGVPVIRSDKRRKKHAVAAEYRRRFRDESGVYLILRARELVKQYESREPKQSTNPLHRNIVEKKAFIDQYYFYLVDKYWGEMCVKISSHLPFNVTVFLNGNRWLYREATRRGLSLRAMENSIVRCSDPGRLQEIADSLDWRRIQSVCETWVYRLLPVLTREERRASGFFYRWSMCQAEMSHNIVFKSPSRLTEVLERHVDLNRRPLQPQSLKSVFSSHPSGCYKRGIDVAVRHAFGGITVLKATYGRTSVKQYNNHLRTFRTEACSNNPRDLGVKKGLQNFAALRQRLLSLVADFQRVQTPVLTTTVNRGELTALAEPGMVNQVPTAGIRLENERIFTVLAALPQLVHCPQGFRSHDLRELVESTMHRPYRTCQAIYDLRKLRGKGLVQKVEGRRLYRATSEGLRVTAVLSKLKDALLEPLLERPARPERRSAPARSLPPPECHYRALQDELDKLCAFLEIEPAA